jgi:hypothetical protein
MSVPFSPRSILYGVETGPARVQKVPADGRSTTIKTGASEVTGATAGGAGEARPRFPDA